VTATQLHPLLTHHVVNTLGWRSLRPLQQAALGPVSAGDHALILAPTAGGKTEAAVFPLLSRMLTEDWNGLSVLYLCPLRALLNNLHPRLEQYAGLVGRRAGLWHGDVSDSLRDAIRNEPPDLLLTTPESIEAMLLSRRTDHRQFFANVQAIVVDEIHAFAGDDRGWHLLAVAERVQRLTGRELQRVGLSATVGNPTALLQWFTRTSREPGHVIQPPPTDRAAPDVTLDHVGTLDNAATVISRLHRGEKRLVFVDSRARVEELGTALRERNVTTFVSHGSLGREERHAAEAAFAEARNCVIVATSTLELGIDVGDLDRVIQVDSPGSVAGFLQRLGRTGRREGAASNALFLTTKEEDLLRTAGLLRAWQDGYVEPLLPPPLPLHLVAQQLLALVLQESGVGRHTWTEWLGEPFVLGDEAASWVEEITEHLLTSDILFEDGGVLGMGTEGEKRFGRRNFMDLMAVFSDPPTLRVLAGRTELGSIHSRVLTIRRPGEDGWPVLLLGGRSWQVEDVQWRRKVVQVSPAPERGKARWFGGGRGTGFEIAQAMKRVLAGEGLGDVHLSERATDRIGRLRGEHRWVATEDTAVVEGADGRTSWWSFAGSDGNRWLAAALDDIRDQSVQDDPLSIRVRSGTSAEQVRERLHEVDVESLSLKDRVLDQAVEELKFNDALPELLASQVISRRFRADDAVSSVLSSPVRGVYRRD
jgi:ATP-dependent helicase Lhr and Lhr-like helicase